jgi:hypothetical protein
VLLGTTYLASFEFHVLPWLATIRHIIHSYTQSLHSQCYLSSVFSLVLPATSPDPSVTDCCSRYAGYTVIILKFPTCQCRFLVQIQLETLVINFIGGIWAKTFQLEHLGPDSLFHSTYRVCRANRALPLLVVDLQLLVVMGTLVST